MSSAPQKGVAILDFRSISEKCLLEEICLESKNALKNDFKNVQEVFFPIPKYLKNKFETIFKAIFHADSEYEFSFFLSCLKDFSCIFEKIVVC